MSDTVEMLAEARTRTGKGPARVLRRADRIPGIVYGEGGEPVMVSLTGKDLRKALESVQFMNTLLNLKIEGGRPLRVLPKDVQLHPVTDRPVHVDFIRVAEGARVTVEVPVSFVNEEDSPGIKRGGVLNITRREVEITCPADRIPDELTFDLKGAEIGDSLRISQIRFEDGVEPTIQDRDFMIASIVAPTLTPEDEEPETAAEAPEQGETEPTETKDERVEGPDETDG